MRPRKIGRYGNSDVIKLKPSDKKDLGWKDNDEVDIDKLKKLRKRPIKSKKWTLKDKP